MTPLLKIGLISLCLPALVACSTNPMPTPIYIKPACPVVPQCQYDRPTIATNGDLVTGLMAAEAAMAICQVANDTLRSCLRDGPWTH